MRVFQILTLLTIFAICLMGLPACSPTVTPIPIPSPTATLSPLPTLVPSPSPVPTSAPTVVPNTPTPTVPSFTATATSSPAPSPTPTPAFGVFGAGTTRIQQAERIEPQEVVTQFQPSEEIFLFVNYAGAVLPNPTLEVTVFSANTVVLTRTAQLTNPEGFVIIPLGTFNPGNYRAQIVYNKLVLQDQILFQIVAPLAVAPVVVSTAIPTATTDPTVPVTTPPATPTPPAVTFTATPEPTATNVPPTATPTVTPGRLLEITPTPTPIVLPPRPTVRP
jgi:hypothetical protein